MANGSRNHRALSSVSIASALSSAILPFTHARSESINADSLNSNYLQLGRRSGGRPQRAVYPRRLPVNTVIHTRPTLAGFEPTAFRLLVRRRDALPVVPPKKVNCHWFGLVVNENTRDNSPVGATSRHSDRSHTRHGVNIDRLTAKTSCLGRFAASLPLVLVFSSRFY